MSALDQLMQNSPNPQNKPKMPMGCLLVFLGLINIVMSIAATGSVFGAYQCIPVLLSWVLFFGGIATPILIRKKLRKQWHWVYLWSIGWVTMMFLGIFVSSFTRETPQCKAEYEALVKYSTSQAAKDSNGDQPAQEQQLSTNSGYKIGESFLIGYTRYEVQGISWKKRLGNEYFGADADSRYLLVRIKVKNEDKENRMIPPFHLVDESGATYDESSDRMYLGKDAVFLSALNPGVQKSATLVFDVPAEHHYRLVVSGGYWSSDDTYVQLN